MDIQFVDLEPRRYAYLRHLGPYPEIGATFGKLAGIAGPVGLVSAPDAHFVGVYHDDPSMTPASELRSDAGITVADDASIPEGLQEGRLPGGRYAKGLHLGSYERMGESWMAFFDAVHAAGAKPRMASPFERYVSDMGATPVDELVTELYAAVE